VTYQPSPINACGASLILGTITDLDGKPITLGNMIVHVEGDADIDTGFLLHPGEEFRGNRVQGRSPLTGMGLGPSAWDVIINLSGTSAGTWTVWLVQNGQASEKVRFGYKTPALTVRPLCDLRRTIRSQNAQQMPGARAQLFCASVPGFVGVSLGWGAVIAVNPYGPLNPLPPAPPAGSENIEQPTPVVLMPTTTGMRELTTTIETRTDTPMPALDATPTGTDTPAPSPTREGIASLCRRHF